MAETFVKIMDCAVRDKGVLEIDRIGVGVGVILYSSLHKTGAGLHVLAADSGTQTADRPAKYANTAIPYALDQLKNKGAIPPFSVAIAGGATMLGTPPELGMGPKIVSAVKNALTKVGLNIKHDQTSSSIIRLMILDLETGKINITESPT